MVRFTGEMCSLHGRKKTYRSLPKIDIPSSVKKINLIVVI